MRFATAGQVVAMVALWAGALFGLDYTKNPHLWRPQQAPALSGEGVHLRLWIEHLCCTGCLADVTKALEPLDWLGTPRPQPGLLPEALADARTEGLPQYGGYLDVPVSDVERLDLVMVDRVVRDAGLVPSRIELGGLAHFRLEADVPHLCCAMCRSGLDQGLAVARVAAFRGQFTWLDSVVVSKEKKRIVAYARYLEPGKTFDVGEFLAGLNFVGFAPATVKVVAGEENAPVGQ